jgi:hypothetical protein
MTDVYMFADMSESQREEAVKLVQGMLLSLRESEKYLADYVAGRVNATKVYGVVVQTAECIQEDMEVILTMREPL